MKLDRRFLDISFCIKGVVATEEPLPNNASTGDLFMCNGCTGGCDNIFKYNGTDWEEIKPETTQTEFFNLVTGDIIKSDGSFWNIIGTIHSYIVVDDIVEDKVGESNSNETHKNGDRYIKTSDNKFYTYNGTDWTVGNNVENGKYLAMYDFQIYTKNGSTYTPSELADSTIILKKSDLSVYAYNSSLGLIKVSSSGKTVVERHTITNNEISDYEFSLANHAKNGTEAQILVFVNGLLQEPDVDYVIEQDSYDSYPTNIDWENKALANVLKVGDKFTVQYLV